MFEDTEGEAADRGRQKSLDSAMASRRSSGAAKDNNKGNVLVSVRVRPDAGSGETGQADGEWMVDGRRSLVSYRGKEGGDYRYGMCLHAWTLVVGRQLMFLQIMSFRLTTTTHEYTTTRPRD
jgi:hypothetical protein